MTTATQSRAGDIIDYTRMRKGSTPEGHGRRRIGLCPRCGRKGLVSVYPDGDRLFAHRATDIGIGRRVTESCLVRSASP